MSQQKRRETVERSRALLKPMHNNHERLCETRFVAVRACPMYRRRGKVSFLAYMDVRLLVEKIFR